MFRNIKAGSGFLFRKGAEFFIMVQQNLIMVAKAGENILNKRFRTVEGDGILVKSTVYRGEIWLQDGFAILQSKTVV